MKNASPKETPAAAAREARLLARRARSGALATARRDVRRSAHPYVSKVGVAWDGDGSPLFLFSILAAHTQDLLADPRAALLLEAPSATANPLEAARATLVGRVERLEPGVDGAARQTYLIHHPGAARYAGFGDFALWRMTVEKVHFVGGFGSAKWARGEDYLAPAPGLVKAGPRLLETLNGPGRADLAAVLGRGRGWRAVEVDSDGLFLLGPRQAAARVDFSTPAHDARSWKSKFSSLLRAARL